MKDEMGMGMGMGMEKSEINRIKDTVTNML
jgi:hypothetical protein